MTLFLHVFSLNCTTKHHRWKFSQNKLDYPESFICMYIKTEINRVDK